MKATDSASLSVDQDSPWLGLASFTEQSRAFFYGREEEVAELERRVQRKILTVLFGKSGLGKTSILQAGLVPGLRARGYFPVYLRIDYGHDAPEPAEQIKQAITRAPVSGGWTQIGEATPGESIWEFLHHRDDLLKDAAGHILTPLLIFDQFEELFTLAQSDEFGRARAARFVEELADLVENRPPKALEAALEADESTAERFDFSRNDYRVVIALREDYLAPLESLKKQMPSLSQNRLRLAPMTGAKALQAVLRPGRQLVSEEVAEAIVRFVAGGSELANAEVEPALLSLICRELNEQRIAQSRPEISLDLLAGSHASILSNFYERALADQPASVRRLIEDELLTESGYRENLAEESLVRRLQAAGAGADALAMLVNRRLLRMEERLDVRRVELTHDVLTGVVRASRDLRHQREAAEATERLLAEQHDRENAARRSLRRARSIAAGCTLLCVVAIIAAALALVSLQRARRAESDARQTRTMSEQAREHAEYLLNFLTDDFVRELESFGRFQTVADLSQREIDYFHALPVTLKDASSIRSGALALVNHSSAEQALQDLNTAEKDATEALALLEQQRRSGDHSEANTIGLARAYTVRGLLLSLQSRPNGAADLTRAADMLRPIVARDGSPAEASRSFVDTLSHLAFYDNIFGLSNEAVKLANEAQRVTVRLGARRHTDATLDADYVSVGGSLVAGLAFLGRNEEARRASKDVLEIAEEVRAQRPEDSSVLVGKISVEGALSFIALGETDPNEALRWATQERDDGLALVKLEPANFIWLTELNSGLNDIAASMRAQGRLRESIRFRQQATDLTGRVMGGGAFIVAATASNMAPEVSEQAQLGDVAGVAATLADLDTLVGPGKLREAGFNGPYPAVFVDALKAYAAALLAYVRGDNDAAQRISRDAQAKLQAVPGTGTQVALESAALNMLFDIEVNAQYNMGDFPAVERSLRPRLAGQAKPGNFALARLGASSNILLSMALAKQGKDAEATRIIQPFVTLYRAQFPKNHSDQFLPVEFASVLYAQSLCDAHGRQALLREAAALIASVAPNIAALHDTRLWRTRIHEAQQ